MISFSALHQGEEIVLLELCDDSGLSGPEVLAFIEMSGEMKDVRQREDAHCSDIVGARLADENANQGCCIQYLSVTLDIIHVLF